MDAVGIRAGVRRNGAGRRKERTGETAVKGGTEPENERKIKRKNDDRDAEAENDRDSAAGGVRCFHKMTV